MVWVGLSGAGSKVDSWAGSAIGFELEVIVAEICDH